ncbi:MULTISPECIES: hypothetical protein [Bacillus cereus group]|uniref:hypothetical protein n=1 Tax=Bacillus cereus group TaxID=86661 RepID=UPI0022E65BF1|nr:hypothetical protein [Bacillus cereus group sp. BcHK140]MCU5076888.1 hypothetical protein [Bacillus cereus]MDA1918162.1 hypothetical protein [Bacillus cereus group sp. BcHK140]
MTIEEQLKEISEHSFMDMIDTKWIMDEFGVSQKTAQRRCKQLGIYHTDQHIIDMIRRYLAGESYRDIIRDYDVSQANFHALLRRRGIERRHTQYTANFHYFDVIDTEAKAYFLGFIYADGCVYRNTLKISISEVDIDILEKLKTETNSNHPIRITDPSSHPSSIGHRGNIATLEISQNIIREALESHGVVPNKTHLLNRIPHTIPKHLIRHFIRGYFDGDGSFSCYELQSGKREGDYKYSFGFVGTESFLLNIQKYIQENAGIPFRGKMYKRFERNNNTRQLFGTGRVQTLKFLDWLYGDSKVYLNRKYNKYRQLLR